MTVKKSPLPHTPAVPPAPWTTAERLEQIEALGKQIAAHVQFMSEVGTMNGASAEAKEKAVIAFYDRMLVLERQLGRIQEELRLG